MASEPFLVLFSPKIPAQLLTQFLKGIGCTEVETTVRNDLEQWVRFRFFGRRFDGHRDGGAWHFFADNGCSSELIAILSEAIHAAEKPLRAWGAVCRGILVGGSRHRAAEWRPPDTCANMTDQDSVALLEAAAVSSDPYFVEHALECVGAHKAAYVPALIALLKSPYHHCHEDIVSGLQRLKHAGACEALFNAALIRHEYLDYDENFGLARKCTWALADIGSPEAQGYLRNLAAGSNKMIAAYAQKRLDRWDEEQHRKGWHSQAR